MCCFSESIAAKLQKDDRIVIGTSDMISIIETLFFTNSFYKALGKGNDINSALRDVQLKFFQNEKDAGKIKVFPNDVYNLNSWD